MIFLNIFIFKIILLVLNNFRDKIMNFIKKNSIAVTIVVCGEGKRGHGDMGWVGLDNHCTYKVKGRKTLAFCLLSFSENFSLRDHGHD